MQPVLKVGISPCPNDTFIFSNWIEKMNKKESRYDVQLLLADVEELNQLALRGEGDLMKVSFALLPFIQDRYNLLSVGGALGNGVGPLLVSAKHIDTSKPFTVALPGKHTTAHALFQFVFPNFPDNYKVFKRYDTIETAVSQGEVSAGVIIHENRFTYADKGLQLIVDLGKHWEDSVHAPIPLGCIVLHKKYVHQDKLFIEECIRTSIVAGQQQWPHLSNFVIKHAQEMDSRVMRKHIELYVNHFSLGYGQVGFDAIEKFLSVIRR
ncbi:MAG: 1,4-dihydroxy-6-naphthoate synthase [Phycisphaerales bacterium]|nr:1,4-dihydroxy-6-naphthoate synthase [Phycisphaerales bacterium]